MSTRRERNNVREKVIRYSYCDIILRDTCYDVGTSYLNYEESLEYKDGDISALWDNREAGKVFQLMAVLEKLKIIDTSFIRKCFGVYHRVIYRNFCLHKLLRIDWLNVENFSRGTRDSVNTHMSSVKFRLRHFLSRRYI